MDDWLPCHNKKSEFLEGGLKEDLGFTLTYLGSWDVQACVTSGFFYIVNHGVDPVLLEEVFTQSKNFFSLPLEEKMKVIHDKNHRGYTPFEEEILDPDTQSKGT